MQKKLDDGKLDPKEKQALKDQLADLSKQLDKLSKEDKQLEDELAQKGLDKSLAQKDIKDLREELKKQGLSDKQIDEMIQKAKESKGACKACKSLSDALKTPGLPSPVGLNSKDLSQSEDQLTEMEAKQLQLQQAQAAQQQCKGAMDKIGQCQGGECTSPGGDGDKPGQGNKPGGDQIGSYKPGESDKQGSGSGGPGRGNGARPTGPDGDTKTNQTKVSNPEAPDAPIIANWYIKGDQVIGKTDKKLGDVVQAKREQAAQAVEENQIPKKYDPAIQKYFDQFEKPQK